MSSQPQQPLRLEYRSPAELSANPRNWRQHPAAQEAALQGLMSEVGWAGAVLFNERTGRLIDGHLRQKVSLLNGAEKIPVLIGSWDEATEAKILLTLDPIAAMAEADAAKLDALLREVETSSMELAAMLTELSVENGIIPGEKGLNDPSAEWQGMPEFEHEDQTSAFQVIVHFATKEDQQAFASLIGQPMTDKTRSLWHPKAEIVRYGVTGVES